MSAISKAKNENVNMKKKTKLCSIIKRNKVGQIGETERKT